MAKSVYVRKGDPTCKLLPGQVPRRNSGPTHNEWAQSFSEVLPSPEATPADDSQRAAQTVSPLAAEAAVFHTQNEEDFFYV